MQIVEIVWGLRGRGLRRNDIFKSTAFAKLLRGPCSRRLPGRLREGACRAPREASQRLLTSRESTCSPSPRDRVVPGAPCSRLYLCGPSYLSPLVLSSSQELRHVTEGKSQGSALISTPSLTTYALHDPGPVNSLGLSFFTIKWEHQLLAPDTQTPCPHVLCLLLIIPPQQPPS